MNKLKYYVDKVKSFDIMELESGTFFMLLLGISASLLTFSYFITEPVVKAPIAQVQVSTVEDEILALEQIGANLIISKINEKSDKKVSLKLNKEGWNAGVSDGRNKININMEKM